MVQADQPGLPAVCAAGSTSERLKEKWMRGSLHPKPQSLTPSAWSYVHLEIKEKEDWDGRKYKQEAMIFPRYHQWDVVRQLVETARAEGPAQEYLIQHSAGSGKSNSIAWVAHQLSALYTAKGTKQFHSVIVVIDRTVLDDQLQETIYQFEHTDGVGGTGRRHHHG